MIGMNPGMGKTASVPYEKITEKSAGMSIEDFYDWGIENGVDYRVLAYLRYKPSCSCTPRQLIQAAALTEVKDCFISGFFVNVIYDLMGEREGSEYLGFLAITEDYPMIDRIIKDPEEEPLPKNAAVIYAVIGSLIQLADRYNIEAIVKYFIRFDDEWTVEAFKCLGKRQKDLMYNSERFQAWCNEAILRIL